MRINAKCVNLFLLGLLVAVTMAPQIALAAEMEYITTNWEFDNTKTTTGWCGFLSGGSNPTLNVEGSTWGDPAGSNTYLHGYRLRVDGRAAENGYSTYLFYLTTGKNDTNTGLVATGSSAKVSQTFIADMSTNVLTFALSKCFASTTGTNISGDYTKANLNIAILSGSDVVWSTNGNASDGYKTDLQTMATLGYLDGQTTRDWVDKTVDLSDVLTGGTEYTLQITRSATGTTVPGFALTNVGIQKAVIPVIPEPSTWAMLAGLSLVGGAWMRRRRK